MMPTRISATESTIISSTSTVPLIGASRAAAAAASAEFLMLRITPPTSDLCAMAGSAAFMTTGNPIAAAAAAASATGTWFERGTGTPKLFSADLASNSDSNRGTADLAGGRCSSTCAPADQASPMAPAQASASRASRWPCSGATPARRHCSRTAAGIVSGSEASSAPRAAPGAAVAATNSEMTFVNALVSTVSGGQSSISVTASKSQASVVSNKLRSRGRSNQA